jgi:hypothetical protein
MFLKLTTITASSHIHVVITNSRKPNIQIWGALHWCKISSKCIQRLLTWNMWTDIIYNVQRKQNMNENYKQQCVSLKHYGFWQTQQP